ncbi:MAG: hypothetical protein ACHBN1_36335 [Heteroscytonema crispum UTEX LB 1556]
MGFNRSPAQVLLIGWGGAMGDLDRDGRLDILQANGMVDDSYDRGLGTGDRKFDKKGEAPSWRIFRRQKEEGSYAEGSYAEGRNASFLLS